MATDLKDTLLLPKTDFPMRAGLVQREPSRLAHWEKLGLYAWIQQNRAGAPAFVLHDGPPFTNGDLHLGHTLNKSLKDFVNRYKSLRGYRTPYVPGWDCHGLPIEQKVSREAQEKKLNLTTAELRAKCDEFAEYWISRQRTQFKRLGVLADWKNEYKTKAPAFEADILRTFAAFAEQGLVYRSKKPVYWSIPFETALAEAEIEYKPHASPSIWVAFQVANPLANVIKPIGSTNAGLGVKSPFAQVSSGHGINDYYFVIWTTTPWTLPANLAIAVGRSVLYAIVKFGDKGYIVAEPLVRSFIAATKERFKDQTATILLKDDFGFLGDELEGLLTRHPFINRTSQVVTANYVTTESGTGCVHTAPGHGAEDYQTGLQYKLPIYCPVSDDGHYINIEGFELPSALLKPEITTLESVEDLTNKKTSSANIAVLKLLAESGSLLAKQRYEHSYPHCWRSKTPIIFRAVDQWFVSLDKAGIRQTALDEIAKIAQSDGWIPAWGEARIRGAVESRPDWCISRQRTWGVPIPVFYAEHLGQKISFDTQHEAVADVIRKIADKIEKYGSNYWFETTAEEILKDIDTSAAFPGFTKSDLIKGRDTLDVWIDSGSTQAAVLKRGQGGTHWPADLYLEGSDQHRGWFQSSLWCSVIAFGGAPYKAVLTHGFIVDEERNKLSKSNTYQKPQTNDAYINEYGADVIRLWIASQDFRGDTPISKEILSHVGESYRLFRNTFRFQLSNLFDFRIAEHAVPVAQMDALDRWALHQTAVLIDECTKAYDAYEFHRVYQLCNQFCSVTLSAVYHDILKDRLYTLGAAHPLRRSSQTALHHIFSALVRILAPVITFTADEAWSYATTGREYADDSVHLQDWPVVPADWRNGALEAEMGALLKVRALVNERIEPARQAGTIGKSLDCAVTLEVPAGDALAESLARHRDFLPELFIVSGVGLTTTTGPLNAVIRPCAELGYHRCPRCWRWVPALVTNALDSVCPRCVGALAG